MIGPIDVVTFDFGNTLVPVDRDGLRRVVELTAVAVARRAGGYPPRAFLEAWAEERDRQFREEIPRFREVDIAQRLVRVLARLRGMAPPPAAEPWDDEAAAGLSDVAEVEAATDVYSRAFVEAMPPPPAVEPLLARMATAHRLGVLSNWPLGVTIDRYLQAAGWDRHLAAVVVSQREGVIKPHPGIFRAMEAALGVAADGRGRILHVGDDWAADIVGAKRAGWLAAHLTSRPEDSPLPTSERDGSVAADLELPSLDALETALETALARG